MSLKTLAACTALAILPLAGCNKPAGDAAASTAGKAPTTDDEKTFYALGQMLGKNVSSFSLTPAELDFVATGMRDAVSGAKPQVEMDQFGPKISALAKARQGARAEAEKAKSIAYLEKAATEPGAQKTPSGLVYFEVTAGTGTQPTPQDTVKVHYRGTLLDGTEFDSSFKRNQPAQFPLSGVIPCWTEGVAKMKTGGKARLVCPSAIAYGDRGSPPNIPGGAALIFEVELLEVTPAGAGGGMPAGHP